jgi:hypothetical protein
VNGPGETNIPTIPFALQWVADTGTAQEIIVRSSIPSEVNVILQGIDAVNNNLDQGSQIQAYLLQQGGAGIGAVVFFQGFTYATSQGDFSWRGSMVIEPSQNLWIQSNNIGFWSGVCWGLYIPA